jgi:hypothetical protein
VLPNDSLQKVLVNQVSGLLHSEKLFEAARLVADWVGECAGKRVKPPETKAEAYTLLNILLHWLLDNGAPEEAAQMLWGPTLFDPRPNSTKRVWKAFDEQNFILLMGAGSMSKSYSMGVRLLLEWIRDPNYTTVKVLGPSEQHLEDNLFSHLVRLHKSSTVPLPGTIGKLFIGMDTKERKGSITGVVVPLGKKAAGRLQGVKRDPRKKPHPTFGKLSRMFVFLDEIANIPVGIWRDIDNVMSNTTSDGGLKIIGAFNPTDRSDPVGERCEPKIGGWQSFDADKHHEWTSTRDWFVVRLDAALCENVLTGEEIFPGLQTLAGFNRIISNNGGTNSANYWSMARGCFPPMGTILSLIPPGMLTTFKGEFIWYDKPRPAGGVDLALEGSDTAKFAHGDWGLATGIKYPPSMQHPLGLTIMFKNAKGRAYPRYALQLRQIFLLPKGDTVAMKKSVMELAQKLGIAPEWLAVDRTGNGAGVHDLLKFEWGIGVIGVNFSESAGEQKIMVEDSGTAKELYDRAQSELWFATKKFLEFDYLKGVFGLDTTELFLQLTGRLYQATGKLSKVEKKADYRSRHQGKSPDDAEAVTLLVCAVRRASGVTLGMRSENTVGADEDDGDYYADEGPRCDITNSWSTLDL